MKQIVCVIGAGLIGRSWAVSFARGGFTVNIFDASSSVLKALKSDLTTTLISLEKCELLYGATADEVLSRINITDSLSSALDGAMHVQENAPEALEAKINLFSELDRLASRTCTLASSTSALLPSAFASKLVGRDRVLVAHPLNPPHLVPAVELVPSEWTSPHCVEAVTNLMIACGQVPIRMKKELPGFVMNRLQGALLHEAFRLVQAGYVSVADVDASVKDGLGMRWSFMGPFETIDLNAPNGIVDFIERYGTAYQEIGRTQIEAVEWSGETCNLVSKARREILPANELRARQVWRDEELSRLAHFRKKSPT